MRIKKIKPLGRRLSTITLPGVQYAVWMAPLLLGLAVYALHLLLKLKPVSCIVLGTFMLLLLHFQYRRYRDMQLQKQRFSDACLYMDTLLYSFSRERKVLHAFEDTLRAFHESPFLAVLQKAYDHMQFAYDDGRVLEHGLELVETAYPCHRITVIHQFLLHVEYYGGEVGAPIALLTEDKNRWERRIRQEIIQRENEFRQILLSVLASIAICSSILMLPAGDIDISSSSLLQVISLVVLLLDDLILYLGQGYLMVDYLKLDVEEEDEKYVEQMKEYRAYNPSKERKQSLLYMLPALGSSLICLVLGKRFLFLVGCLLTLILANQHRIGHRIAGRALKKKVRSSFPGWLLDLALLLQTENVQVALTKSRETVPPILRIELDILLEKLEMNPEAAEPYHEFLKDFSLPEVHSAMSLLYSLSAGNSGNAQKQMEDLIARNLEMQDAADALRMKDKRSGMFLLFLAPVLTASMKLLADMGVFLLAFLSSTMQTLG